MAKCGYKRCRVPTDDSINKICHCYNCRPYVIGYIHCYGCYHRDAARNCSGCNSRAANYAANYAANQAAKCRQNVSADLSRAEAYETEVRIRREIEERVRQEYASKYRK